MSSFLSEALGVNSAKRVRLIKGSHIVVPRLYPGEHPYILQNDDKRIVFVIPFEGEFSLIGTTDVPYEGDPAAAAIVPDETGYLCRVVNRYFKREIAAADVVWSYAGVRPLYDDASGNASAVTRDYVFDLDAGPDRAPLLSIFGGKITTYRKLAEHALEKLQPVMGFTRGAWTAGAALPGGDMPDADFAAVPGRGAARASWLPEAAPAPLGARLRHAAGGDRRRRQPTGRISAAISAAASTRPRSTISSTTSGRGPRTTCSGAARELGLHVGQDTVVRLEEMLGGAVAPASAEAAHPMSLRLDQVRRTVGKEVWIDTLSLDLQAGQLYVLLGPTLAGKTSLMRLMAGLDRPTAGPHPGRRPRRHRHVRAQAQRRHGLSAVHQLPDAHRLRQHRLAAAPAGRRPRPRSTARCGRPPRILHIDHLLDRLPAELSGGQQQRLAIARALVKNARRCCCSTSRWSTSTTSCARSCAPSCASCSPGSRPSSSTPPPSRSRR